MRDAASSLVTWKYAFFGTALAFAGPPIYIHAPKFYADHHGISLMAMGWILLALRGIDFVQDPILGWWIARHKDSLNKIAVFLAVVLGLGMALLFSPVMVMPSIMQFSLALIAVFTGFSGLQILYYSSGVEMGSQKAGETRSSHEKIATWREAGVLIGICAACVTPALFELTTDIKSAHAFYALVFVFLLGLAIVLMANIWVIGGHETPSFSSFNVLLQDAKIRRLLVIGFLNSLPVGVTATLFLFFVDDRLGAEQHAGPMLLLFFLSAALATPLWGRAASYYGLKKVMLYGMSLSIISFSFAWSLQTGDVAKFYLVCAVSGAALGADMTLLPAMLSQRLETLNAANAQGFGLWGFINKATLALAAGLVLPALSFAGYDPVQINSVYALEALGFAYTLLPCFLKLVALGVLALSEIDSKHIKE